MDSATWGARARTADIRAKRDAAFSARWSTWCFMPNTSASPSAWKTTTSEMGDPSYLRAFVEETRLTGLRFNF